MGMAPFPCPLSHRELRYLDVSGLAVPNPGLLRILLEEMLPGCHIVGMELESPPSPAGTT